MSKDIVGKPLELRMAWSEGLPSLQWPSIVGQRYEIETSSALDKTDWISVASVDATGPSTLWTDPGPLPKRRYYRVTYRVEEIVAAVSLKHGSEANDLPEFETASFDVVRERLEEMARTGTMALPLPLPDLDASDAFSMEEASIHIDSVQRTIAFSGEAVLRGQTVQVMLFGVWPDDESAASGFNLAVKFPRFRIADWVGDVSGTMLDELTLDGAVLTVATAPQILNLRAFAGDAAGFYGRSTLEVGAGVNFTRLVDLSESAGLTENLRRLGFTDTTVNLDGLLGIGPGALFRDEGPSPAIGLHLRASLPEANPAGLPALMRFGGHVLEITNTPAWRIGMSSIVEVGPDGQSRRFDATTEIDTEGGQTAVTLMASLAQPWEKPFGIDWLTLDEADLAVQFTDAGAGEVALSGAFALGDVRVATEIRLVESETDAGASFVASAEEIRLTDVLDLLSEVSGTAPFGDNLPDDALVFSDVRIAFDSSDARSVTLSGTTTILDTIRADALLSFVKPDVEADLSLLVLSLRVYDFRLSALYEGINGTLAGDLVFPGVAFTIVQDLPDPPSKPITIPSGNLDPAALDFYEPILGTPPYVLEVEAGVNFSGTFAQSRLPSVVLDALGMDPDAEVLLEGGMGLRLGALSGGGVAALDNLRLEAVLPPPARPRGSLPEWMADLQPGERVLEFRYEAPDITVRIADSFEVELDGAARRFVTSTTLATDGDQASVTLAGDMAGGWAQPFGIDWLDLDSVGMVITQDGSTGSATLHASFGLGGKTIQVEITISGGSGNRLVRFKGAVDSLSLSDFVELARKHLGPEVDPFGDSDFDFTFTNVRLAIETGTRRSFSLGADTTLREKATRVLFSAMPSPEGGAPQISTGFQMQDWSLAEALEGVRGTFVEDFRLDAVALVFSKGEGTAAAADMDEETREFYQTIYGTPDFRVPFRNGLGLIGRVPLEGHPLDGGLDALGMSTDALFLTGSVPGSIVGLGGGGGGLSGLSLIAGLPPLSPPDSPEWFVEGQLGLEITAQPSVGFVGSITVEIEGETLTFSVSAAIQRSGAGVEFALSGALEAEEPWVEPFGIEWLVFNRAAVKVSVNSFGGITLGFAGDMVIGEKDIDVAVAVTLHALTGAPTNFIFEGASEAGVSMSDLVMLQQRMARVDDPAAPMIPLETLPDMALRKVRLKFAPKSDRNLGVEAGFAIGGELWIPSELDGPADRNFAVINASVDRSGVVATGFLGTFTLGPIVWEDAICDLVLSLPAQHLFVAGAADVGSFFRGDLDVGVTRTGLSFLVSTTIFGEFEAELSAEASFSLNDPQFEVQALLQNDFAADIGPRLAQKLKTRAGESTAFANDLLRRGLSGWTSFRNNPQSPNFAGRITGFASAAGWPSGEWTTYVNAIQDTMNDIDAVTPDTPSNLLDLALGGFSTPGVPGVKTTVCIRRQILPPFNCLEYQDRCNGVPYAGGPCWTVPPITIGGACHEPSLSQYNIACSATPFIEQSLIPPLVSRIDTILQNGNRSPMCAIEGASFTAALNDLTTDPVVDLASTVRFMQAATPLELKSTWDFDDRAAALDALRDALLDSL